MASVPTNNKNLKYSLSRQTCFQAQFKSQKSLHTDFIIMIISEISVKETYNDINHISMETSSKHLAVCQIPPPLVCPIARIMTNIPSKCHLSINV